MALLHIRLAISCFERLPPSAPFCTSSVSQGKSDRRMEVSRRRCSYIQSAVGKLVTAGAIGWIIAGIMIVGAYATGPKRLRLSPSLAMEEKCWVFLHMSKCGGSSFKEMLGPWARRYAGRDTFIYDSAEWNLGEDFARTVVDQHHILTWGAYVEGLRRYGAQECKWFTMFRQ